MIHKNVLNLDQLEKVAGGFGAGRKSGQSKVTNARCKSIELKSPSEYGFLEDEKQRCQREFEQKLIDMFDFSNLQEESKMDVAVAGLGLATVVASIAAGAILNENDSKN